MTKEEGENFIRTYGSDHIKKIINGSDLIYDTYHYVLDLKDVPDEKLSHEEQKRVEAVKNCVNWVVPLQENLQKNQNNLTEIRVLLQITLLYHIQSQSVTDAFQ
jgi:hypothetical protein